MSLRCRSHSINVLAPSLIFISSKLLNRFSSRENEKRTCFFAFKIVNGTLNGFIVEIWMVTIEWECRANGHLSTLDVKQRLGILDPVAGLWFTLDTQRGDFSSVTLSWCVWCDQCCIVVSGTGTAADTHMSQYHGAGYWLMLTRDTFIHSVCPAAAMSLTEMKTNQKNYLSWSNCHCLVMHRIVMFTENTPDNCQDKRMCCGLSHCQLTTTRCWSDTHSPMTGVSWDTGQ